ncbi:MAG: hypothetical protein QME64_11515 [bacterium]|nr:hypothetical protein [bacterium]
MKRKIFRMLTYGLLIIGALILLTPFIWLVSTSFKDSADVLAFPPQWIPKPWIWSNYNDALVSLSDEPNLTLSWENIHKLPFLRFTYNTMFIIFLALLPKV